MAAGGRAAEAVAVTAGAMEGDRAAVRAAMVVLGRAV